MPNTFEVEDKNPFESPVENIKWYATEDQTQETTFQDKGKGDAVLIRLFEFKLSPTLKEVPTTDQILTPEYVQYLHAALWADDLRIIDVNEIRVVINKDWCQVFVPCQARTGSTFLEEPKLIQEWTR